MRICIDVRYKLESGASTYMKNLVEAMLYADGRHEFVLLEVEGCSLEFDRPVERLVCPPLSAFRQYIWVQRHLPGQLRRKQIDLYHSLKHLGPFHADCKLVYSMQSLGGYVGYFSGIYPMPFSEHVYWRYCGRQWLKRLDWLITCASFIGDHISSRYGYPANRITCVPHGRDPFYAPMDSPRPQDAPARYILQVANLLPVKNTIVLVRAFGLLASRHPDLGLIICGDQSHPYYRKVLDQIDTLGLHERVQLRGFVAQKAELRSLFCGAEIFALPSLHEGCPVALMEAMACGVPCVTSDRAGLPELGGDATLQYQPAKDPKALAAVLDRVLTDTSLRGQLVNRSIQRAQQYTWERAAQQTLSVFDKLDGNGLGAGTKRVSS